jgi:hypothetical protein
MLISDKDNFEKCGIIPNLFTEKDYWDPHFYSEKKMKLYKDVNFGICIYTNL